MADQRRMRPVAWARQEDVDALRADVGNLLGDYEDLEQRLGIIATGVLDLVNAVNELQRAFFEEPEEEGPEPEPDYEVADHYPDDYVSDVSENEGLTDEDLKNIDPRLAVEHVDAHDVITRPGRRSSAERVTRASSEGADLYERGEFEGESDEEARAAAAAEAAALRAEAAAEATNEQEQANQIEDVPEDGIIVDPGRAEGDIS